MSATTMSSALLDCLDCLPIGVRSTRGGHYLGSGVWVWGPEADPSDPESNVDLSDPDAAQAVCRMLAARFEHVGAQVYALERVGNQWCLIGHCADNSEHVVRSFPVADYKHHDPAQALRAILEHLAQAKP